MNVTQIIFIFINFKCQLKFMANLRWWVGGGSTLNFLSQSHFTLIFRPSRLTLLWSQKILGCDCSKVKCDGRKISVKWGWPITDVLEIADISVFYRYIGGKSRKYSRYLETIFGQSR